MKIKAQEGISGIDIIVSLLLITIFMSFIITMISNINQNSKDIERKSVATSYAVQEIEKIKSQGYLSEYDDKGISSEETIAQEDINDENGDFTGYSKEILIKDYCQIEGNEEKEENILKIITVIITYNSRNQEKNITLSTYITKE